MSVELVGRSSSHYTRVARLFADELRVPVQLVVVRELTSLAPRDYGGNPALKMPTLRRDGASVFGAENVCRVLAELADPPRRIVWPEQLRQDVSRNAQEMVWHAMSAQVQLVLGANASRLPADDPCFAKGRRGLEGALGWLEEHLDAALGALPSARDLSLFEATLFCLVEHLPFRATVPVDPTSSLARFAATFALRPSAERTRYRFDAPLPARV